MIQTLLITFEKEHWLETQLYDKNEGIHYNADPDGYWNINEDFIFEDCFLTGLVQNKRGRYEEHVIKINPSKRDLIEVYTGRHVS